METVAAYKPLTQFVVWAPDRTDPGTLEKRLALRPRHLENVHHLAQQGIMRVAGGVLTSDSASAAPADRKFFGSCIIIEAESLEAACKQIESDVCYENNVWDKEMLQILPLMVAILPVAS